VATPSRAVAPPKPVESEADDGSITPLVSALEEPDDGAGDDLGFDLDGVFADTDLVAEFGFAS
jgi:hypothetical protein